MPDNLLQRENEHILIVDDDGAMLRSMQRALESEGFKRILTCDDPRRVSDILAEHEIASVLLDLLMPHLSGEDILSLLISKAPDTPAIMVTAIDDVETAVRCVKAGAFDYLTKPIDLSRLATTLARALQQRRLRVENSELKRNITEPEPRHPEHFSKIVTASPSMMAVFRYVEAVAASGEPCLIVGETGVGKELIAEALHKASGCAGEMIPVNVAAIDKTAFADTLFGHSKGAFTGADRDREGLIENAAGGTLFMDEIGDLDPEMQTKLLRLIQEREYLPLGCDRARKSQCRVIAATNKDLRALMRDGRFRDDLYYRLHSHLIRIPPLRERTEDIPLLLKHFMTEAAAALSKPAPTPPPMLQTYLSTYPFPGNVRELRAMVYDALARHDKGILSMSPFLEHMDRSLGARDRAPDSEGERIAFGQELPSLKETTILLFREALRRTDGNQSLAARLLGVSRRTLNRYCTSGQVDFPSLTQGGD